MAAELDGPASIVFDQYRVPTVVAQTEHDAIYLQGYMHARDRLFQMDFQRRLFAGKASEMLGSAALAQDVQLRTLGLDRAAQRSLAVQTPETMAWLQAYADGVNAYLANTSVPLPPEYGALEMDRDGIPPWTPLDTLVVVKGLAFGLSFDLGDIDRTLALLNFRGVGEILGFNGFQLFNADLYRVAPFDATISIPTQANAGDGPDQDPQPPGDEQVPDYLSDPNFEDMLTAYRDEIAEIPILENALENDGTEVGSNWWVADGSLTASGFPMIANDPHLSLGTPATFYEIHLSVENGINVTGISFPGAPGLVQGCNDTICWGSTVNSLDVTDVYQEVLIATNPAAPTSPTHSFFRGSLEPLQFIPQTFLFNYIGDGVPNNKFDAGLPPEQGGVTIVVPRRNNGPIVSTSYDPSSETPLTGFSVMYTGWSGTQELEAFRLMARASSPTEFRDALQFFDVGSQNWAYADVNGNIAYFTSAELPIREDLQTLFFPDGLLHPGIIRDGTGTNKHEWLPVQNPQPNQAIGYEMLPFDEMPQVVNPGSGYILNANNDPIGTTLDNVSWNQFRAGFNGLLYLAPGYATGFRIGRLKQLFDDGMAAGPLTTTQYKAWQGNNQLLDAEVLTPYLLDSFDNAAAPGAPQVLTDLIADPRLGDAISRLSTWDFSTPTGLDEGWDPSDATGVSGPAPAAEIDASVAATIYAVWRGQVTQRVIDQTLANLAIPLNAYAPGSAQTMSAYRYLMERYPVTGGTGASLINFFNVPGVPDQDVARDVIHLESLRDALDLLASSDMAAAFGNSTNLDDYRWGKLHRIVFAHTLGGPFSVPGAGAPDNLAPDLPGYARAGGMGSLDAAAHSARADGLNEFMFGSGPSRRFIATMTPDGPEAIQVIPGGESGVLGSPNRTDQLALWLANEYHPLPVDLDDVNAIAVATEDYICGDGTVGPGEQCDDGNANENDGCNQACRISPIITCSSPTVSADPDTCTAEIACDVIASCIDPAGGVITLGCAPTGPYGLGQTDVTVQCDDSEDLTTVICQAAVADTTPPAIQVTASPDDLWPPNHRMEDVVATVTATDACGTSTVVLESVVSDEPDNAEGNGDGNTVDDIQGAEAGTEDYAFQVRAERASGGNGRVYTATYTATDGSGNVGSGYALITVAHDRGGKTDPLELDMTVTASGTLASWVDFDHVGAYNLIRGSLSQIQELGSAIDLGGVTCLEAGTTSMDNSGSEDMEVPPSGDMFFYLIESDNGKRSSYGSQTVPKPRSIQTGDCR